MTMPRRVTSSSFNWGPSTSKTVSTNLRSDSGCQVCASVRQVLDLVQEPCHMLRELSQSLLPLQQRLDLVVSVFLVASASFSCGSLPGREGLVHPCGSLFRSRRVLPATHPPRRPQQPRACLGSSTHRQHTCVAPEAEAWPLHACVHSRVLLLLLWVPFCDSYHSTSIIKQASDPPTVRLEQAACHMAMTCCTPCPMAGLHILSWHIAAEQSAA